MINLKEFLLKNISDIGGYAIVSYNNKTEPIYFAKQWSDVDNQYWFLESPCELYRICKVERSIDEFCKEYVEELVQLNEDTNIEEYIEEFIKPMVKDNWFYEIENFQVEPYLPKVVDDIKIIPERECLEWILSQK